MSSRLVRFGFNSVTKLVEMFGLASLGKRLRNWFVSEEEAFWSQITNSLDILIASGSGDVFIDLGAHTGEQAIPASFHLPVIAFEPDPIAARNLRQRMSSLTEAQQITVYEVAASDKSEHSILYGHKKGPQNTASSTMMRKKRNIDTLLQYTIETIDIGAFLKSLPYSNMIIKCDVEGAEYKVLNSIRRHKVSDKILAMYTEFHDEKIPFQWLPSLKFTFLNRYKLKISQKKFKEWH